MLEAKVMDEIVRDYDEANRKVKELEAKRDGLRKTIMSEMGDLKELETSGHTVVVTENHRTDVDRDKLRATVSAEVYISLFTTKHYPVLKVTAKE